MKNITRFYGSPQWPYIVMEAVSGWDDGEVRLVFEELETEDDSTVASADDNDVLIRGERGTGSTHLDFLLKIIKLFPNEF